MQEEKSQEDILIPVNNNKLYTLNAIRIATFLGGPWITGYLVADNFKKLGRRDKVAITWILTIVATIIIFAIAFVLPPQTPSILLPVIYSAAAYYIVKSVQGNGIALHIQNGGAMYTTWRAVAISLISLLLIVIIWAVFFYFNRAVTSE